MGASLLVAYGCNCFSHCPSLVISSVWGRFIYSGNQVGRTRSDIQAAGPRRCQSQIVLLLVGCEAGLIQNHGAKTPPVTGNANTDAVDQGTPEEGSGAHHLHCSQTFCFDGKRGTNCYNNTPTFFLISGTKILWEKTFSCCRQHPKKRSLASIFWGNREKFVDSIRTRCPTN